MTELRHQIIFYLSLRLIQLIPWLGVQFSPKQPLCELTDLPWEFISESIKNANNLMTQVLLCHAEADRTFSERLLRETAAYADARTVYGADQLNRLQTDVAFQQAIRQGIEVGVAAPQSQYFTAELQPAVLGSLAEGVAQARFKWRTRAQIFQVFEFYGPMMIQSVFILLQG